MKDNILGKMNLNLSSNYLKDFKKEYPEPFLTKSISKTEEFASRAGEKEAEKYCKDTQIIKEQLARVWLDK